MLRSRRSATRSRSTPAGVVAEMVLTDSIAAQRTSREPCLVIRPRWTWVSDSWCLGVSPAQQVSLGAEADLLGWADPQAPRVRHPRPPRTDHQTGLPAGPL